LTSSQVSACGSAGCSPPVTGAGSAEGEGAELAFGSVAAASAATPLSATGARSVEGEDGEEGGELAIGSAATAAPFSASISFTLTSSQVSACGSAGCSPPVAGARSAEGEGAELAFGSAAEATPFSAT